MKYFKITCASKELDMSEIGLLLKYGESCILSQDTVRSHVEKIKSFLDLQMARLVELPSNLDTGDMYNKGRTVVVTPKSKDSDSSRIEEQLSLVLSNQQKILAMVSSNFDLSQKNSQAVTNLLQSFIEFQQTFSNALVNLNTPVQSSVDAAAIAALLQNFSRPSGSSSPVASSFENPVSKKRDSGIVDEDSPPVFIPSNLGDKSQSVSVNSSTAEGSSVADTAKKLSSLKSSKKRKSKRK